jgi:hypothetical protein
MRRASWSSRPFPRSCDEDVTVKSSSASASPSLGSEQSLAEIRARYGFCGAGIESPGAEGIQIRLDLGNAPGLPWLSCELMSLRLDETKEA